MSPIIPILPFYKDCLKPGTGDWLSTSKNVRKALEEYGCFIIEYDPVPIQLHNRVLNALKELFDLPSETKMKNRYHDKPLNGYVGQIPFIPLHESLGVDNATSLQGTQLFTQMIWPAGNDSFRDCVHEYAKFVAEIDQKITQMIFESYGVDKYYNDYIKSTNYLLRLLKNQAPEDNKPTLGFVTHTDKSFTTVLHQNEVNALEMETRDGERVNVHLSSPSLFMVIAGDALMAWSNDRVWSPKHRVIMSGKIDRYSLGLFSFNNGILKVPEELVDQEHPLSYKPFDHLGLLRFYRTDVGSKSLCPIKAYCGV